MHDCVYEGHFWPKRANRQGCGGDWWSGSIFFGRAKSVVQGAFTQLEACRASILFLLATASFRPLKLCTSSVGIFFGVLSAPVRLVFL